MVGNYLLYNGQSYTGAFIFIFTMQALKYLEDFFGILLLKANAVVFYFYQVVVLFFTFG